MTQKVYRTAQGKVVDIGALQLQNETVRAVGNMNVNARGDVIDAHNRPVDSRSQLMKRKYQQQQQSNVQNSPVIASSADIKKPKKAKEPEQVDIPVPPEDFDDNFEAPADANKPTASEGLAAAIARARQIRQDPVLPVGGSSTTGINKI